MAIDAAKRADLVSAEVLDHSILAILGQIPGKRQPEFVDRIITMYMETALTLLADLKLGLATADATTLHHASHALKACSATIGAGLLSARCEELELMARTGSVSDAQSRVDAIAREYRRVESALIGRLASQRADGGHVDPRNAPLHSSEEL